MRISFLHCSMGIYNIEVLVPVWDGLDIVTAVGTETRASREHITTQGDLQCITSFH